jgi:hypothetical protein
VLQLGSQTDDAQLVVPCAFVQTLPQPPQWFVLARRSTSHPFAGAVSQSA